MSKPRYFENPWGPAPPQLSDSAVAKTCLKAAGVALKVGVYRLVCAWEACVTERVVPGACGRCKAGTVRCSDAALMHTPWLRPCLGHQGRRQGAHGCVGRRHLRGSGRRGSHVPADRAAGAPAACARKSTSQACRHRQPRRNAPLRHGSQDAFRQPSSVHPSTGAPRPAPQQRTCLPVRSPTLSPTPLLRHQVQRGFQYEHAAYLRKHTPAHALGLAAQFAGEVEGMMAAGRRVTFLEGYSGSLALRAALARAAGDEAGCRALVQASVCPACQGLAFVLGLVKGPASLLLTRGGGHSNGLASPLTAKRAKPDRSWRPITGRSWRGCPLASASCCTAAPATSTACCGRTTSWGQKQSAPPSSRWDGRGAELCQSCRLAATGGVSVCLRFSQTFFMQGVERRRCSKAGPSGRGTWPSHQKRAPLQTLMAGCHLAGCHLAGCHLARRTWWRSCCLKAWRGRACGARAASGSCMRGTTRTTWALRTVSRALRTRG